MTLPRRALALGIVLSSLSVATLAACSSPIDDGLPSIDQTDLAAGSGVHSSVLNFSDRGSLAVSRVIDDSNRSDAVLIYDSTADGSMFSSASTLLELGGGDTFFVTEIAQNGPYLAAAVQAPDRTGHVVVWNIESTKLTFDFDFSIGDTDVPDLATHVVFSGDGSALVSRNYLGEIAAWDLTTGTQLYRVQLNPGLGPYLLNADTVVETYANPTDVDKTLLEARSITSGESLWSKELEGDVEELAVSARSGRIGLIVDGELSFLDRAGAPEGDPVALDGKSIAMVFNRDGSSVTIATQEEELLSFRVGAKGPDSSVEVGRTLTALAWSPSAPLLVAIPATNVGAYWQTDDVVAWSLAR